MNKWQTLCHIDDIEEGQSKGFEHNDQSIFVVRQGQQLYVYHNRCPHLGINLEWQDDQFLTADGTLVQCAMHGALFLIDTGLCIAGPCQGQRLNVVEHRLLDGRLQIRLPATTER